MDEQDIQDSWLMDLDRMLRDERSLPLEFDRYPFFNKDFNACACWLKTGSTSSMGRFLICIDAQDKQDERLLHTKLGQLILRCELRGAWDYRRPDS